MNMHNNEQPAEFSGPGEVRLVRLLPGPIERVWDYLTDADKRSRWFAGGAMEPRAEGELQLVFHHKKLAPDETPPDEYKEVHYEGSTMPGRVLRWEPPRVLAYTFGEASDVTFELTPQGTQVLLVLTHRARGEDIPQLSNFASGWHTHVSLLLAILEGKPLPPFWATHARLLEVYSATPGACREVHKRSAVSRS
jgi:uncharacterized protein YndB with AHSA1/START domain